MDINTKEINKTEVDSFFETELKTTEITYEKLEQVTTYGIFTYQTYKEFVDSFPVNEVSERDYSDDYNKYFSEHLDLWVVLGEKYKKYN